MNQEKIETLLQKADDLAGRPAFGHVTAVEIRLRVHRRQVIRTAAPLAAAAAVAVTIGIVAISTRTQGPAPRRIASLDEQVNQLQERTDATLLLVQQVLEQDRRQRRVAAAEAELASVPDPVQQVERQVDKTVFSL
ncbi:MAG: hypothetical protein ABFE01_27390, partial [Phycisphaerales bacterium]